MHTELSLYVQTTKIRVLVKNEKKGNSVDPDETVYK